MSDTGSLTGLTIYVFQDLPNNMIHQVPIKSLPQEWLWCETWCDDSSKKSAKTIDLVTKTSVNVCVDVGQCQDKMLKKNNKRQFHGGVIFEVQCLLRATRGQTAQL